MWITRFWASRFHIPIFTYFNLKCKYNPLHTSPKGGGLKFPPSLWGGLGWGYLMKYLLHLFSPVL